MTGKVGPKDLGVGERREVERARGPKAAWTLEMNG